MVNEEKVNILVVDDLPEKLLVIETVLEGLGQNVVTARSGREALRRLLEREFAVILLDVNMPDMDGFETAAMIRGRRQTAQTPIIFITALSDEMHTAQGYSLGAVDYILSPVVPEILRTKVGVFVDLYKKTQQVERQAEARVALAREQAARAAAEDAARHSEFLAEASSALVRSLDDEAIPRSLARQVVPFLGDLCAISLLGKDEWKSEMAWSDPANGALRQVSLFGELPIARLSSLIHQVMQLGESTSFWPPLVAAENAEFPSEATLDAGDGTAPAGFERCSAIVIPLRTRGRVLGTIALARRDAGHRHSASELALANDLAGRAAIAIDNARLYRDIQENDRRKNEFLAMLAHELRNPLAPIRNAVLVLRKLGLQHTDLEWAIDVVSRQVEQMVRLVDDLLDISRITEGKIQLRKEPIDVALAVARAVETSKPLIETRKHELVLTLPDEPVRVEGDMIRIAQVLANLLNNAAKYTSEGGRIELEVALAGDEAVFRVRDNGTGISADLLPSVFDLFTQADRSLDRSQGGLGIGLTLVRRLVEMHGGSAQAFSEGLNRGSEFVIRIPALMGVPANRTDQVCAPVEVREAATRRVLVVDDNPDVARSLARVLRLSGHDVSIADDGPTALEELSRQRPEVVLLDIGLPGMDGYEVAQSIRQKPETEAIILVALTGYGQDEDRRRSRESGFDFHLVKPVDPDMLLSLLNSAQSRNSLTETTPSLLSEV